MIDLAQSSSPARPRPKLRLAATAAALTCVLAIAVEAPSAGAAGASAAKSKVSSAKRINVRKRAQSRSHHAKPKTTSGTTSTPSTPSAPSQPSTPTKPTAPTKPTTPKPTTTPKPPKPTTPTAPATPTTPTTPTIPTADSIFSAAKIKDFALVQSAPGAITEVPDPLGSGKTVLKTTVSDKDVYPVTPTENPRAQALSPDIIKSGDEFWLQTSFMLPSDFPSNVPGWVGLGSIYGEPFNGPSPWQLDIEGNQINWPRNSTYNWDVPWQMPIVKGQWITVLLHERFATDGWVEMWVNGQPIKFFTSGGYNPSKVAPTERLAMKTMDKSNNGGANSAKIANYREVGMFSSLTIYFGALRVGKTRASVEG